MDAFLAWATNVVQLDRRGAYVEPVQVVTMDNHSSDIRAFLGFASTFLGKEPKDVSLSCYEDPVLWVSFMTFLKVTTGWGCWGCWGDLESYLWLCQTTETPQYFPLNHPYMFAFKFLPLSPYDRCT
jgi:hypothetical protein